MLAKLKTINTASKTVDSLLNTRSRAIRVLIQFKTYQDSATQSLLDLPRLEKRGQA